MYVREQSKCNSIQSAIEKDFIHLCLALSGKSSFHDIEEGELVKRVAGSMETRGCARRNEMLMLRTCMPYAIIYLFTDVILLV